MNSIPQNYISSIEVAEMVGKDHRHLLGDIRRYCEQLGETKIGLSDFFETSTYQSEQERKYMENEEIKVPHIEIKVSPTRAKVFIDGNEIHGVKKFTLSADAGTKYSWQWGV